MAFNYNNRSNNNGDNIVAQILKQAQSEFLYLFDNKRLYREQVIEVIQGLNEMGKALKCFVNRPKDLGQVPSNLFYLDSIEDLESAEEFGKQNSARIINLQIVHNPKRSWASLSPLGAKN